jgi:hypothetical protein
LKKFSRRWVPKFSAPAQKVARTEASTEILRNLHESEENHFEGISTGNESWFQYSYPSSKMFSRDGDGCRAVGADCDAGCRNVGLKAAAVRIERFAAFDDIFGVIAENGVADRQDLPGEEIPVGLRRVIV